MTTRKLRTALMAVATLCSIAAAHAADKYPDRPIKLVVGIAAGSTTDVVARVAARRLSEALGQPVVVDNRAGAGGTIAAGSVVTSPADGYTIFFASSSLPTYSHFYSGLRFDPQTDLVGAGAVAQGGMFMLTRNNAPWSSIEELLAYAKSKPAGSVTYGSGGVGSISFLYSELIAQTAGVTFLHVPYKSSVASLNDLVAGQVDFVFDGPTTSIPQIKAGSAKALGYSKSERSEFLAEVPTIAEAGIKGFSQRTWFGLMVPKGTPKPIIDRLSGAIASFVDKPAYKSDLAGAMHEPLKMSAADFQRMVIEENKTWEKVVKGIKNR